MPEIQQVVPKYLQIANYIREQILTGDFAPGSEVPSERQLAETWRVARPTAGRALETLRREGLVESRQGSGTFVREVRAHRRPLHRYHRYRQMGAQYAGGESLVIVRAEIADAPSYVIEALRLEPNAQAMVRERIISRSETGASEIATSWWPADMATQAPRLLVRESLGGMGSVRYVESVTGRVASYARDQVAARLATTAEVRALGLGSEPSAVLVYRHTVFDQSDDPLEFAEATYPPDLWTIEQEYPIND